MEEQYEYGALNHFELKSYNPRRIRYLYVDTKKYLADRVFANHRLSVKFEKGDLVFVELGYRLVFCNLKKRDRQKFLDSMADLERKMLLQGHTDYPEACREIITPLIEYAIPGELVLTMGGVPIP